MSKIGDFCGGFFCHSWGATGAGARGRIKMEKSIKNGKKKRILPKLSFLRVKKKPRCGSKFGEKKEKFSAAEKRDWFCAGEWVFNLFAVVISTENPFFWGKFGGQKDFIDFFSFFKGFVYH